ncbi:MAG: (Fe-S)-binding protein [Patescibacteria group bacterium]|nr:(Fe-S)-binding protein [Patescibacteria group bacterium]
MAEHLENIRKFQGDVQQCMKCGFCGYFCPIYREQHEEKGLARGKDQLIRLAIEGEQELTKGFYQAIDNCLLCRTCVQFCPAKTRTDHAVIAARADYVAEKGLPWWKRLVFRHILPHRRLFGMTLRMASWFQHVLPRREGKFRHLPQFLAAMGAGRAIPDIAPQFLRSRIPERTPAAGKPKYRVGFFAGCAMEYMFPAIGEMVVEVLRNLDCEVVFDHRQGCCGAPVYLSGDFRTGKKLAVRNVEAFDDCDYVITVCATCGSGLKEYPTYLAETADERARFEQLAAKVIDFSRFVIDILAADLGRLAVKPKFRGKTVTWHDPCHLARYQDVREQPRKLLQAIEGLRFVEMANADRCCGLGGSFSITHYDVSQKIADHKVDAILASGADAVVTACPGCIIQLRDALTRRKAAVEVLHIGELFTVQPATTSVHVPPSCSAQRRS